MAIWNLVKLGEIASITSSKRIFAKEYQTEGIPFYRGKEIIEKHNGNDVSTELYILRDRYEDIRAKFDVPKPKDILLTSVGTLGVPWLVDESEFYFKDGNLTWIRCNEKTIPEFLYLWFNSSEAQNQIETMCIGSTQKALTIEILKKFDVILPPLEMQNKICAIINPISNKIKTNTMINRNLSEQIQVIFVDLFGEEIRNTKIGEVVPWGDLITVIDHRGKNLPFTTDITDYPIIDVGALRGDIREIDFRVIDFNNCTKFVNEETYNNWFRSGHPKVWVILLSTVGNLDEMKFFIGKKGCIAQNVVALTYCEKGSVERHNGLIRRFIPKGKRIDQFDVRAIIDVETWINSLLRKLLGYKTADELFEEELDKIYHVDAA